MCTDTHTHSVPGEALLPEQRASHPLQRKTKNRRGAGAFPSWSHFHFPHPPPLTPPPAPAPPRTATAPHSHRAYRRRLLREGFTAGGLRGGGGSGCAG